MSATASVAIGPAMEPDEERAHQQRLRELYADEAEQAVKTIERKLVGMQAALEAKRAEAATLRAAAKEGAGA